MSSAAPQCPTGAVNAYLAELDRALAFDPHLSRRVHDEVEAHLRDASDRHGEADAVRRFGLPAEIARAFAEAALPDRLRRSCIAAAVLGGATLMLMRLRAVLLEVPGGNTPLIWLDRAGLVAALLCILAGFLDIRSGHQFGWVRHWLYLALGFLGLSVGASLLRAAASVTNGWDWGLILASALIELLLVLGLMLQLVRLERYAHRLSR